MITGQDMDAENRASVDRLADLKQLADS